MTARERARPLAPDDRRAAILDAVIPLLKERGRAVSTKEMAHAARVAEGTLFRSFGDKESIIAAAIGRAFDPEPFRDRLRAIDPDEPTEQKVLQVVTLFLERFSGVVGSATAMSVEQRPPSAEEFRRSTWFDVVGRLFRPGELAVPAETLAFFVRLVAFGAAVPGFTAPHPFTADELAGLVMRGVLPASSHTKG